MRPVATAAEMRAADKATSALGLPSIALMELAAHEVVARWRALGAAEPVTVLTGPGQNGGDGWAIARRLHLSGATVAVWPGSDPGSGDASLMASVAQAAGVPVVKAPHPTGWIVDAAFGTGLSRDLDAAWIERFEACRGRKVLAVDLPSGLCSETGRVRGAALRATATVTFGAFKRGLVCGAGPDLAGDVIVADIGLGRFPTAAKTPEFGDLTWPRRVDDAHKGAHVAVWAGSDAMAGAAALCCRAALVAGAGLVTLVWAGQRSALRALPPEVMVADTLPLKRPAAAWAVGPGLGQLSPTAVQAMVSLWTSAPEPIVADADALTHVAWLPGQGPRVITPHAGEAARLLGVGSEDVDQDRFGAVARLGPASTVSLLKGRHTLIRSTEGIAVVRKGHPCLATGGSGDVLTGLIGGLLARGVPAALAALLAADAAAAAGERLGVRKAEGWRASDILKAIQAGLP